jgi:ketosteroid isomerase-like protein
VTILRSAALVAAALFAVAGCQKPGVDTSAVEAEIKGAAADWAAAYNAGDADALAARYADHAVVMPANSPMLVGRDAFRAFIAKDSAAVKAAGLTLAIDEGTAGVVGDLAWHSGSYTLDDASGATAVAGDYLEVQQNMDGKWMIVQDIWNTSRAMPAAAEADDNDEGDEK